MFNSLRGVTYLTKLKTADGRIAASKPELLNDIESFYGHLYTSRAAMSANRNADLRAPLTRHYIDDIPDVDQGEIEIARRQLKNGKAPGEDGITTELLKAGGRPVELQKLFNTVLHNGTIPKAWGEV